MIPPEYDQTDRVLMQTAGFRVIQIADNAITITRTDRLYRLKSLIGIFVSCFAGGIGYMTVSRAHGSSLDFPAQAVGYVLVIFFGMFGIHSLFGILGLGREFWYVTRNLVKYRDGLFRRKSANCVVQLYKDTKLQRQLLFVTTVKDSILFWDRLPVDLAGSLEEFVELGHLISQFSGCPYFETEANLDYGSAGGGGA